MATWTGVDINTGAVELPKYNVFDSTEISTVQLGTALANSDVILGPVLPPGVWLKDVTVAATAMDSAVSKLLQFEVGYVVNGTTTAAGIIKAGNTIAGVGGVAHADVAGAIGYTNATFPTQVQAQITAAAGTAVAGTMVIMAEYTSNP